MNEHYLDIQQAVIQQNEATWLTALERLSQLEKAKQIEALASRNLCQRQGHSLEIDPASILVCYDCEPLALSPQEYALLYYLWEYRGFILMVDWLAKDLSGSKDFIGSTQVQIFNLRQKIEPNRNQPIFIKTHIFNRQESGYYFDTGREPQTIDRDLVHIPHIIEGSDLYYRPNKNAHPSRCKRN